MFSSPVGVFFLSMVYTKLEKVYIRLGFHPLSGFSSYLYTYYEADKRRDKSSSPVGVFFLFIIKANLLEIYATFSSPVGVFFLFILKSKKNNPESPRFRPLSGYSSYLWRKTKTCLSVLCMLSFHPLSGFSSCLY